MLIIRYNPLEFFLPGAIKIPMVAGQGILPEDRLIHWTKERERLERVLAVAKEEDLRASVEHELAEIEELIKYYTAVVRPFGKETR